MKSEALEGLDVDRAQRLEENEQEGPQMRRAGRSIYIAFLSLASEIRVRR